MFKATGTGKIEAHREFVQAGVLRALLYNFDFDDYASADKKFRDLKPEHQKFLKEEVVPLLSNGKANIWMQGSASQIGADSWNMVLSQIRVGRVVNFLSIQGIDVEHMQQDAIGEENAKSHSLDDERDRGVLLWVYPRFEYEPPPPRKVPKKPLVTRHFKISMVTGLNVAQALRIAKLFKVKIGAGLAIDGLVFLIWDPHNQIACYYVYIGIGLGFGFSALPSVAVTTHGPWTDFTTEKPMSCWQFGRWARFTSGGGGSHTVNWITFETPRGINNVESLPIATGTTYGVGATSTIGDLIRASDPYRFSGP
jgi:hypothetical protein